MPRGVPGVRGGAGGVRAAGAGYTTRERAFVAAVDGLTGVLLAAETTPAALRPAVVAFCATYFAEPDPPLAAALDRLAALYEELRAGVVVGGWVEGVLTA